MGLEPTPVQFKEAIDYLKGKVRLPTKAWTDLWQGMHAKAFVVAGATSEALLCDMQAAVLKGLESGTTLATFRKDFDQIVAKHGWQYRGPRGWRTRVIFSTNLRMAYSAGRYKQAQAMKTQRPYLRYVALDDGRTRPEHLDWHNTVLPVDHPFWKTHTPPNGWNCRCTAQSLNKTDVKSLGLVESKSAPPVEMQRVAINTPDGPKTVETPKGIDPGFGYNPGEAAYGRILPREQFADWNAPGAQAWESLTPGDWQTAGRFEQIPVDAPKARLGRVATSRADLKDLIARAIGGDQAVLALPNGAPVAIDAASLAEHLGRDLNRGAFAPLLPEMITDPFEVWLSFERHKGTGRVRLTQRALKIIPARTGNLIAITQASGGRMNAWTIFPSDDFAYLQKQRRGKLVYGRGE